tara:strand:- start:194 stop:574 length:381 start_codon:yes stop_codon:yes gene_type:complete
MKVINHLENLKPLSKIEAKYLYGDTSGEVEHSELSTSKQLWKIQDLTNKCFAMYFKITTVANNYQVENSYKSGRTTLRLLNELSVFEMPMRKEHANTKIKALTDVLEKTLPEYSELVQAAIKSRSA